MDNIVKLELVPAEMDEYQVTNQPGPSSVPEPAPKKRSGKRIEKAALIASLYEAGSNRVKLESFVYTVDDVPMFDAARVYLDGQAQNLVFCCDRKCSEKPIPKRFFSVGVSRNGSYHKSTILKHHERQHRNRTHIPRQEFISLCSAIMTKISNHELPGDFWSSEEMFEFVDGLVGRQIKGEPVTQLEIENQLEKLFPAGYSPLAIEDGDGSPPTKKIKTSSDQAKRHLLEIWEKEPARVTTEDSLYAVDEYSEFELSRIKLDDECFGLMRCNHPICAKKPLEQRLCSIWFSSKSGAPHKYSVRRHHEQNHFDKNGGRAAIVKAAAFMIADAKLPLDSWTKPSFRNFLSTVCPLEQGAREIAIDEIVEALKSANRPLCGYHQEELKILNMEHLLYHVDPTTEVKIEDQDHPHAKITEIEEIGNKLTNDEEIGYAWPGIQAGYSCPGADLLPSSFHREDRTISSNPSFDLVDSATTPPDGLNLYPPTSDSMNTSPPTPDPMNSTPPPPDLSWTKHPPKVSTMVVAEVQTDDIPLDDKEVFKENPEGSHLYAVYERWAPILSTTAKQKLIEDFSLKDPLYQNPEDIEDDELKDAVRDEWIHAFPSWLDNFAPRNAKDDGSQKIPLSDILALRRMYKSELQKRRPVST